MDHMPGQACQSSSAVWIPTQPGRTPGISRRPNVDFAPISYPPLSQAPKWAQTSKVYIPAATSRPRAGLRGRPNVAAGLVAFAIVVVGGGSIAVAADHSASKASSPAPVVSSR